MTSGAESLEFRQGKISFLVAALWPLLGLIVAGLVLYAGDGDPHRRRHDLLFFLAVAFVLGGGVFDGRQVVRIDDKGVRWNAWRGFAPWSEIEACAASESSPTLRLFLRRRPKFRLGRAVDIHFSSMEPAKPSLDRALKSCAAWIVATRDPAIVSAPIREFVEPPPPRRRRESRTRKIVFFALGLLVPVILVILSVVYR